MFYFVFDWCQASPFPRVFVLTVWPIDDMNCEKDDPVLFLNDGDEHLHLQLMDQKRPMKEFADASQRAK
jgi:hypothetical protein